MIIAPRRWSPWNTPALRTIFRPRQDFVAVISFPLTYGKRFGSVSRACTYGLRSRVYTRVTITGNDKGRSFLRMDRIGSGPFFRYVEAGNDRFGLKAFSVVERQKVRGEILYGDSFRLVVSFFSSSEKNVTKVMSTFKVDKE